MSARRYLLILRLQKRYRPVVYTIQHSFWKNSGNVFPLVSKEWLCFAASFSLLNTNYVVWLVTFPCYHNLLGGSVSCFWLTFRESPGFLPGLLCTTLFPDCNFVSYSCFHVMSNLYSFMFISSRAAFVILWEVVPPLPKQYLKLYSKTSPCSHMNQEEWERRQNCPKRICKIFIFIFEAFSENLFSPFFLTEVGDVAKQYIEKGRLVPDHVITRMMLSELENRQDQHWLLDGEWDSWVSWISGNSLFLIEFRYCSSLTMPLLSMTKLL